MELGKIGTDRQDMACVIVVNLVEERGYILRVHIKSQNDSGHENSSWPRGGESCLREGAPEQALGFGITQARGVSDMQQSLLGTLGRFANMLVVIGC